MAKLVVVDISQASRCYRMHLARIDRKTERWHAARQRSVTNSMCNAHCKCMKDASLVNFSICINQHDVLDSNIDIIFLKGGGFKNIIL